MNLQLLLPQFLIFPLHNLPPPVSPAIDSPTGTHVFAVTVASTSKFPLIYLNVFVNILLFPAPK